MYINRIQHLINYFITISFVIPSLLLSCQTNENNKVIENKYEQIPLQIQLLTKQIEKEPDNPELYYKRANIHLTTNNVQNAVDDINKAINLASENAKYYELLAGIYFQSQNIRKSLEIYNKAYQLNPKNIGTNLSLAKIYLYLKKHDQSIKYVNNILKINIYHAEAYFLKGINYKEKGDMNKAISSFQTAIEQAPDYYHAYMQIGLLFSQQQNKLAPAYFDNAIRIDSANPEAYYAKGIFYQSVKAYDEAIETYRQLINIDPQYEKAFYNIGYIYLNLDSLNLAYGHFNVTVKISPYYAEAYYMRGYCSELMGNKLEAKHDYRQANKLDDKLELAIKGLERLKNI